jgi:hypothetical protein
MTKKNKMKNKTRMMEQVKLMRVLKKNNKLAKLMNKNNKNKYLKVQINKFHNKIKKSKNKMLLILLKRAFLKKVLVQKLL